MRRSIIEKSVSSKYSVGLVKLIDEELKIKKVYIEERMDNNN